MNSEQESFSSEHPPGFLQSFFSLFLSKKCLCLHIFLRLHRSEVAIKAFKNYFQEIYWLHFHVLLRQQTKPRLVFWLELLLLLVLDILLLMLLELLLLIGIAKSVVIGAGVIVSIVAKLIDAVVELFLHSH